MKSMDANPSFVIKVEPHGGSFGYRWTIYERGHLRKESRDSFPTKRAAEVAGGIAAQRLTPTREARKKPGAAKARAN
jgi:hypothetical protein